MRFVVIEKAAKGRSGSNYLFVRDGWSLFAFIAPVLWALWNRFWLGALAFLVVMVAIAMLGQMQGQAISALIINLLFNALIGIEGGGLRVLQARWNGGRLVAIVHADSREEAEIRFAEQGDDPVEEPQARPVFPVSAKPRRRDASAVLFNAPARPHKPSGHGSS